MKALIIEDDRVLSGNVAESIQHLFHVQQAFTGREGISLTEKDEFDVIILDIMMPNMSGYEVLKYLRDERIDTPVLFLTALNTVQDKVKGLKAGADDYLAKPFDIDELTARLEALVRRNNAGYAKDGLLTFLDLTVNVSNRTVKLGENVLALHGKQFDLLEYLVSNKNVIVHKERIFKRVWGFFSTTEFNVVEVYTSQLRKLLKPYGYDKYLKTVRGLGYILTDDADVM